MTNLTGENKIVRLHKISFNATGIFGIFNLISFLCVYYIVVGSQQFRMLFFVLVTALLLLQVTGLLAVLLFKAILLRQKRSLVTASAAGDRARGSWLDLLSPKAFFWVALQMFILMWTWVFYTNIFLVALSRDFLFPASFSSVFSLVYGCLIVLIVLFAIICMIRNSLAGYADALKHAPGENKEGVLAKRNVQANLWLLIGCLCFPLCYILTMAWVVFSYLGVVGLGILIVVAVMKWRIAVAKGTARLWKLLLAIFGLLLLAIPVVFYIDFALSYARFSIG